MTQRGWWSVLLATTGVQLLGVVLVSEASAKNCQTVADCGGPPALCELTTYQTCAGQDPACPAGSACGEKPTPDNQADCVPYVEGICRQPYELPCQSDVDCGAGFRCIEQIGRACSGMATSGGNGVPPSWHEECHETRGTFRCELVRTRCAADRDCEADLRCLPSEPYLCDYPSATTDDVEPAEPGTSRRDCPKVPMLCAPDGYFGDLATTPRAGSWAGTDTDDQSVADGADPALDRAAAESGRQVSPHASDEGCSLATSASAAWPSLGWLALTGLLAARRRRRTHA